MEENPPEKENYTSCYLGLMASVFGLCLTIYLINLGYGWYVLAWFGLTFVFDNLFNYFVAKSGETIFSTWEKIIADRDDEAFSQGGYFLSVIFMVFMTCVPLMFAPYFWLKHLLDRR